MRKEFDDLQAMAVTLPEDGVALEVLPRLTGERNTEPPRVSVCVCTYRRPGLLQRLLESLTRQRTAGAFTFSVVIADNDAEESARPVVAAFAAGASFPVVYCVEPRQNIALVRNKAIEHARGEFIAFIDDDEFPAEDWLEKLLILCEADQVAGVLGPVRPHFDSTPPGWILRGGFVIARNIPPARFSSGRRAAQAMSSSVVQY